MPEQVDVIVIGAGAAGLAAARSLADAGLDVLVLEARGRLGGRIFTHRDPAWPAAVELGAEFLHGEAASTRAVAREAGLLVHELPERHVWASGGRWRPTRDMWRDFIALCARIDPREPDRSFAQFLAAKRPPPALGKLARMLVEGYHAAPVDEVSARSLAAEPEQAAPENNRQYRLPGGYDRVIRWLRESARPERVSVRLHSAVTEVRWRRRQVEVSVRTPWHTRVRAVRARAALLTLPVGVLQADPEGPGGVRFTPPLASKRRALSFFGEAKVAKIVLRFREAFWETDAFVARRADGPCAPGYFHDPGGAFPTWWTQAPAAFPLLTGWAGGPAAARLSPDVSGAPLAIAVESLAGILGVSRSFVADRLDGCAYHDWSADPWSRGAYTFLKVGGAGAAAGLARPLDDTLFFAGESTSGDEIGTVSGALASGLRAARQVVRALSGRRAR